MKILNNFLGVILGLNIYAYGLGIFLSLVLVLFLFWRNVRKTSYNEEKMVDALFTSGVVGLILGRAMQVVMFPDQFPGQWGSWLNLVSYPGISRFFFWSGFFGFWYSYSLRKKLAPKTIEKVLFAPIVYGQLLGSAFALLVWADLWRFVELGIMLTLIGGYFLITRVFKKTTWREHYQTNLALYLGLPPLLVDFLKPDRVYFLEQKIVSIELLPYIALFLIIIISGLLALIKRKK